MEKTAHTIVLCSSTSLVTGQCGWAGLCSPGPSLLAQKGKCLLAMQETWVRSLGKDNPLEKGMASHSSIHAWRILWTKEPGGLQSRGVTKELDRTEQLTLSLSDSIETPSTQDLKVE